MCDYPHCGKTFQKDDYYEVEDGDEWECPKCEKPIHVVSVDHITNVRLSTAKEQRCLSDH